MAAQEAGDHSNDSAECFRHQNTPALGEEDFEAKNKRLGEEIEQLDSKVKRLVEENKELTAQVNDSETQGGGADKSTPGGEVGGFSGHSSVDIAISLPYHLHASRYHLHEIPPALEGENCEARFKLLQEEKKQSEAKFTQLLEARVMLVEAKNKRLEKDKKELTVRVSDLKTEVQAIGRGKLDLPPATHQKVVLRQLLWKFRNGRYRGVDVALMRWADKKHPKKFSVLKDMGFMWVIMTLMTEKSHTKNAKRMLECSDCLDCLKDAAMSFCPMGYLSPKRKDGLVWSKDLGKEYFILCKNVVQWNSDTFHPEITGPVAVEIKRLADENEYILDGVNIGELVKMLVDKIANR